MTSVWSALLVCALGVTLLMQLGPDYVRARRSQRWPRYPAEMIEARAEVAAVTLPLRPPILLGSHPVFRFRYTVSDRFAKHGYEREGSRFRFGSPRIGEAQEFALRYPPGSPVAVAVNPTNFDDAVLVPGPTVSGTIGFVVAWAVFLSGVAWLGIELSAAAP